jgi:hypothetical protein
MLTIITDHLLQYPKLCSQDGIRGERVWMKVGSSSAPTGEDSATITDSVDDEYCRVFKLSTWFLKRSLPK